MESQKHIQILLDSLQHKIGAQTIMLLETTGQILYSGRKRTSGDTSALASLIIGINAASQQLGLLMGEKNYPIVLQEGSGLHFLSTFITKDVILAIFIDRNEKLGFVRFKVKQYQVVLKALVERLKYERQRIRNPLANVTEEELDRLLRF